MRERRVRATNLEAVIAEQGRTKRWVAEHGGFSPSMLSHLIAGRKTISYEAAQRVATVLQVPFFVLFESSCEDNVSTHEIREEVLV